MVQSLYVDLIIKFIAAVVILILIFLANRGISSLLRTRFQDTTYIHTLRPDISVASSTYDIVGFPPLSGELRQVR